MPSLVLDDEDASGSAGSDDEPLTGGVGSVAATLVTGCLTTLSVGGILTPFLRPVFPPPTGGSISISLPVLDGAAPGVVVRGFASEKLSLDVGVALGEEVTIPLGPITMPTSDGKSRWLLRVASGFEVELGSGLTVADP